MKLFISILLVFLCGGNFVILSTHPYERLADHLPVVSQKPDAEVVDGGIAEARPNQMQDAGDFDP